MSDDPDGDGGGTLVRGPWSGDSWYAPPPIPDFADTIPVPDDIPAPPPESPEETTMHLPPIPAAPDPAMALRSDGVTRPESGEGDGESEEGEYVPPRSLADRLGDWLDFRIEKSRAAHESETPFRDAEIARKVALLEGRTAQEVAMMEQNGKLHAAMMKAKGDKAAARGKGDADRMKSSGSGGGSSRNNSGAGANRPGARGSNSGGNTGRSGSTGGGKGGAKGPDRPAGGRGANGPSGGSKGSHAGSGSSGRNGGGSSKGDGGRGQHRPAGGARAERAHGRQERAGARQTGRQERRTAAHNAGVADRTRDRDQARANRQKAWEDRRAKRQERDEARKAKRESAASADPGRTTVGAAVAEEAQRRWDKRRADAKDAKDAKGGEAGAEKANLPNDKDTKDEGTGEEDVREGTDGVFGTAKDDTGSDAGRDEEAGDGPSDGSKKRRRFRRGDDTGRTRRRGRSRRGGGRQSDSPFGAHDDGPTVEWPENPTPRPGSSPPAEDLIEDAFIVDDPTDPCGGESSLISLLRAPEKHTARPGTSRPPQPHTEGSSVSSAKGSRPTGHGGLAAKHRTDITFDEYLVEMANTALQAASVQERAQVLVEVIGRVADALRDMATDLANDHNIGEAVTDLIMDVADAALRMKQHAQEAEDTCGIASEASRLAATLVARVYGEDMAAKEDAGLRFASAAAHHD